MGYMSFLAASGGTLPQDLKPKESIYQAEKHGCDPKKIKKSKKGEN
jgi:hypothetical protein